MYSTLDKVDIVTTDKGSERKRCHQTDHRRAFEIEEEPEVSVLFGLTKVLNARRMGAVSYVCFEPPPDFFLRALASAGAEVVSMDSALSYEGPSAEPADLADEAFRKLAERVLRRRKAVLGEAALTALERWAFADTPTRDEDEITYWTRVVELAAVAGELLRRATGGRWIEDPRRSGTIPFVFHVSHGEGLDSLFNVAGKAEKLLEVGERESLIQLAQMAADSRRAPQPHDPVMPCLKPADWEGRDQTACRPLLYRSPGPAVPLIAYGHDRPHSFAFMPRGDREIEDLHAEAVVNLRAVDVEVHEVEAQVMKMLVVSGNYFAAEKLLDAQFMTALHVRLSSPLLAACPVRKGLLFVTTGVLPPEIMGRFMALCEHKLAEDGDGQPITSTVLLVQEGRVCGLIAPHAATAVA